MIEVAFLLLFLGMNGPQLVKDHFNKRGPFN